MIVKYFYRDGQKLFDVVQALKDGCWGIKLEEILTCKGKGLKLVDRENPDHKVTVSLVTIDRLFEMYFVWYEEGGGQCLDDAINQFGPKGGDVIIKK